MRRDAAEQQRVPVRGALATKAEAIMPVARGRGSATIGTSSAADRRGNRAADHVRIATGRAGRDQRDGPGRSGAGGPGAKGVGCAQRSDGLNEGASVHVCPGVVSAAVENRPPFFDEGVDRLGMVLGVVRERLRRGRALRPFRQFPSDPPPKRLPWSGRFFFASPGTHGRDGGGDASCCASTARVILPVAVLGSSSSTWIAVGHL